MEILGMEEKPSLHHDGAHHVLIRVDACAVKKLCICLDVKIIVVSLRKVITVTVITNTISRYEILR